MPQSSLLPGIKMSSECSANTQTRKHKQTQHNTDHPHSSNEYNNTNK